MQTPVLVKALYPAPHGTVHIPEKHVQKTDLVISAVDSKILLALYRLHYLTVDQIREYIGIRKTSQTWLRDKVRRLSLIGFLHTQFLPRKTPFGRLPMVYSLAAKGIRCLESQGLEVITRWTPKEDEKSFIYLDHVLRLNDVIIAALCLEKQVPGVSLAEFRHDRVLKHYPVKVTYTEKEKTKTSFVIPDGWLDFHLYPPFSAHPERVSVIIELDRDTVDVWPFRSKIRKYVSFIGTPGNSPYETAFGSEVVLIAWIAAEGGERRARQMKQWVESELKELGQEKLTSNFLFTHLPYGPIDPATLFLSRVWTRIGAEDLAAIIEKLP